jgi:rhodanese-related sulfurtransferase
MKFFLAIAILVNAISCAAQPTIQQVSVTDFESGITGNKVQLLDVRTAAEFKTGHLANALQADWNNQTQFKERTQHLDKASPIYLYCLSGVRSAEAAGWLQQQGYTKVVALQGGINAWKRANKPIEGNANIPQLSMEQYHALIPANETVLVDFGAEWCPPCKRMEPILTSLLEDMKGQFKLVKIDGGVHANVMKAMNVEALPVFIVYKNRKEVWRKQGITSLEELQQQLK